MNGKERSNVGDHSGQEPRPSDSGSHRHRSEDKLNRDLDWRKLELCVPKTCELLNAKDQPKERFKEADKCVLPDHPEFKDDREGLLLRGQDAIDHASRVHDKIHRRALRLQGVRAIDVGFAVREEAKQFENVLAVRVHVTEKPPHDELVNLGRPDLTTGKYDKKCRDTFKRSRDKNFRAKLNSFQATNAALDIAAVSTLTDAVSETLTNQLYRGCTLDDIFRRHPLGAEVVYVPARGSKNGDSGNPADIDCCDPKNSDDPRCRIHICGVPLDVIQAEYFPTAHSTSQGVFVDPLQTSRELRGAEPSRTGRGRINTIVGGVSIGNESGQAGTLGAVVWDRTDGSPCILSNFHVLAGSLPSTVGQPCYQPGIFDGGSRDDVIAYLKRWRLDEDGDMGIAELDASRPYASREILGMWDPIALYQKPELNLEVRKYGRTTGFTQGFIDGLHLATNIDYGDGVPRFFKGQFHIAPLYPDEKVSQDGDSGALVLTRRYVGTEEALRRLREALKVLEEVEWICSIANLKTKTAVAKNSKWADWEKIRAALKILCDLKRECKEGKLPRYVCELLSFDCPDPDAQLETDEDLKKLQKQLASLGFRVEETARDLKSRSDRGLKRFNMVVGMLFAGDTAGSPFGEFALATDFKTIEEKLQISLSPVFEPRSSFRELREDGAQRRAERRRRRRRLEPEELEGDGGSTGPQPDPKTKEPPPGRT